MARLIVSIAVVLLSVAPAFASGLTDSGFFGAELQNPAFFKSAVFPDSGTCEEPIQVSEAREALQALSGLDLASYRLNPVAATAVDRKISLLSVNLKKPFSLWLTRSGIYLELLKEILREEGVPEEMAYLPLIESGFNPFARSRARAVGMWQFIAGTAKRYGLKVNRWVDERRDPVKSTRAAARYLKDLYGMFGSWSLAMAAYNAGEGKIQKALDRHGSDDYWDIVQTKHIKRETKDYVPLFIAARLIAENPEDYGFIGLSELEDFSYEEVAIDRPLSLQTIAKLAGTTPEKIKELNPELKGKSTPPVKGYTLRIPAGCREAFLAGLPGAPTSKEKPPQSVYTVKKGDTIWKIAKKTGAPRHEIIALNKVKASRLRIGQQLVLPD